MTNEWIDWSNENRVRTPLRGGGCNNYLNNNYTNNKVGFGMGLKSNTIMKFSQRPKGKDKNKCLILIVFFIRFKKASSKFVFFSSTGVKMITNLKKIKIQIINFIHFHLDMPTQMPPLTPGTNKKLTEVLKASFASWEKEVQNSNITKGKFIKIKNNIQIDPVTIKMG